MAVLLVLPCILLAAFPGKALGAWAWEAVPAVVNEVAYDDNILFEGESGLEYRLSPSITFAGQGRRSGANLSAALSIYRYVTDDGVRSDFNRTNQFYAADVSHQATRRLGLGAFASLSVTDSTTLALEETGIPADESRAHAWAVGSRANWSLDPLSTVSLSYGLDGYIYESGAFSDSLRHTASLGLSRQLNPSTSGSVTATYQNYRFDNGGDDRDTSHTGSLNLGVGHAFSPRLQGQASLGGGVVYSERSQDSTYNAVGSAGLSYAWSKGGVSLALSRSYERSVLEEVLLVDAVSLGVNHSPLMDLTLSAGTTYRRSQGTGADDGKVADYFSVYESIRYALSRHWSLSLSHTYSHVESFEDEPDSNRIVLSLSWAQHFPL